MGTTRSRKAWPFHCPSIIGGLTFTHGVVSTMVVASLLYQWNLLNLSTCSMSWVDISVPSDLVSTANGDDVLHSPVRPDKFMEVGEIDRRLRESYQQKDIRGDNDTLLGHYYFDRQPSSSSSATETATALRRKQHKLLPLSDHQKRMLDDAEIHPAIEKERCQRYNFQYNPQRTERRRIFYGATLADDSFFLLQTIATEGWEMYHTVAFVESNMTHTRSPRHIRFPPGSDDWHLLQTMFGKHTHVTVDYFVPVDPSVLPDEKDKDNPNNFNWQHIQREAIVQRWKRNGMRPDDIGFLADADEHFSRDFLRALQICDVPEFQPGQDCEKPKIVATTLIYEASPECIVSSVKLWKPDIVIGECIEGIGDPTKHKPPDRQFHHKYSSRTIGHGRRSRNYTAYFPSLGIAQDAPNKQYPLWNAADYRNLEGGRQITMDKKKVSHNAFHFHNFFESTQEIRHKYATYGEPLPRAEKAPLTVIHDDLGVASSCIHGWQNGGRRNYYLGGDKEAFQHGPRRPIFFENEEIRRLRHQHLKYLILQDELKFGTVNASCSGTSCRVL